MKKLLIILSASVCLASCGEKKDEKLPIMGERVAVEKEIDGKKVIDTLYHRVPEFTFVNQDSTTITQENVAGKVYVADFFFTTCPTICPKMKSQLLRVYEKYKDNPNFLILSHSVDTEHDTVAVLKDYANRLEISSKTWHLLTGEEESIYKMAGHYLLAAQKDSTALGGYDHSGKFMLIDTKRHIRATCNGTDAKEVDRFMKNIDKLLKEESL